MAKPTPGPWELRMDANTWDPDAPHYPAAVVDATGERVRFACVTVTSPSNAEALANARLIAAAPDLLEALKALEERCTDCWSEMPPSIRGLVVDARAATAKAEGK